jgi:hypothetical protein
VSQVNAALLENVQALLDRLNTHHRNRTWWRKLKDWWLYPKGHGQIAMNEGALTLDQYLLLKTYQLQIDESARGHQLSMVTWLLVVLGFATLIVVVVK